MVTLRTTLWLCATLAAVAPGAAAAQDGGRGKPSVPLHRLTGNGHIQLDGFVDEPAWADIDPVPLVMYSPTYGGTLTEETEIRIAYDDGYLYVSGRLFDSDLGGIRANSFVRDGFSGDDQFSVVIDSYNDHETAVAFVVNPNGARSDRAVWGDAEWTAGTRPFNSDWNAHWDAAVQRTNDGWSAEMRIPFSTLGFQNAGGEVTMGLSVYRSISRKNERHVYPDISPEYGFFGFGKPSLAQRVTLRDVNRANPIYVTPYLLGGMTQIPTLREPPDVQAAYWATTDDPTGEPGLDFRYSPSSNLSIDLTANTDFAQVEADDQQINLTRFPLFFPEKRQFFQERSATFDFATGGVTDRVFFSRRIGLDQGELVRIYGGARVVGRAGGLDFGMLNMQTAPRAGRPGENMGVLRLKQQIFNQNSSVGGIVTTRVDAYGKTNVAYGADSEVRVFGDEYLTLRWAQSFDDDVAERNPLDAGTFFAQYERRRQEGLNYSAQYRRVGPDYLPRLGFQLRNDFTLFGGSSEYSWFLGADSQLRAVTVGGTTEHYYRNSDLTPESRSYAPMLRIALKSGTFMTLTSRSSFESIRDPFRVASLRINPGEYWFHEADMSLRLSRGGLVRGELGGSAGSFYDGRRVGLRMSPALNVSRHVEIRPGYDLNRFELRGGDYLTTHLAKLGVDFSLDTHLSLSVLAQYNSAADQALVNARFRYHFREGVDLWVVYNEGYYTDRVNGRANNRDPMLPFSSGRALMVKYSHTLAF
ncbi:DUF5916 domain-containing protein [Candidatus Palauibacter polyketidifaciens]|uniref:DUF5916 domain-containing protein n=1 Tax=Candidatus Palauibacter polyketidifaciens TaxID=3056740 RepID=UPI0023A24EB8|nr:DUF5916 domain-containing protein [Candidatus Palauibacter polyketidifaciens]MDE2721375.1 DUF5916 domain-containing protein [Candidatus Palauibacter polyketidifaciens]